MFPAARQKIACRLFFLADPDITYPQQEFLKVVFQSDRRCPEPSLLSVVATSRQHRSIEYLQLPFRELQQMARNVFFMLTSQGCQVLRNERATELYVNVLFVRT